MTLSINFHPEVQILNHLSSYIPQSLTQSLLHKKDGLRVESLLFNFYEE